MVTVRISQDAFRNEEDFHQIFSERMGFLDGYGNNWNAWIDCMSYVDEPESGMCRLSVKKGESLEIEVVISGIDFLASSSTWSEFSECVAFVNDRFAKSGSETRLIVRTSLLEQKGAA